MSDEDRATGEGRSQVMNLLTIDTNIVASLATIAPGVSNSIISCGSTAPDRRIPLILGLQ